jgi:hypothetical protein
MSADLSCTERPKVGRSVHRFAFLDMLFAAPLALEGKEIRQPAKSRRSANELHRPGAGNATRRLGRGLVGAFVVHDRVSSNGPHTGPAGDMRCEHYRDVAGSLMFRNLRRGASPPICDRPNRRFAPTRPRSGNEQHHVELAAPSRLSNQPGRQCAAYLNPGWKNTKTTISSTTTRSHGSRLRR